MSFGPSIPDFDALVALHEDDPEAFEHFRRMLLEEAVDSAPAQHQPALDELVATMERTRNAAATPLDAVIAASRAMQDSVEKLVSGWARVRGATAEWQTSVIIERLRK